MTLALVLVALAIGTATAAAVLLIREAEIVALNKRVSKVVTGLPSRSPPVQGMVAWLASLGGRYRRFYSAENLEQLRTIVQSSGFNPHQALPIWIGVKAVSAVSFPLIALIVAEFLAMPLRAALGFALVGMVIGIMGPRFILSVHKRKFDAAVRKGIPDTIDLLVVCSEAGMGLESAVERVAEDMEMSNPPMSRTLSNLLDDLRILPNRREAFDRLGATSEGLHRFGSMVSQSLQYGTPLSQALRSIAEELRRDSMITLEKRAHELGGKLIIPMVLFLLPAMFVIMGGSSFLHLIKAFKPQ
ncbi:type II secretion system F family protein [uncultured Rhodoblastus sp.]|uniref:type II secretion system F family protein n=1 Tax=uncultured Rhodoblastus sp. TaxID=543037 RepID=UPI0025E0A599|nr:type II secretion system F family protein [uncultured Rhodoblastus sp.]